MTLAATPKVERTVLGVAPPVVVRSDGARSWLDREADVAADHPATLVADPRCDDQRRMDYFLWDLCGYLIIRNGMGPAWAASANAAHEWAIENGRKEIYYTLPHPHCAPFRELIAAPAVTARLGWIMGAGYTQQVGPRNARYFHRMSTETPLVCRSGRQGCACCGKGRDGSSSMRGGTSHGR
jgi:hypothetical protein